MRYHILNGDALAEKFIPPDKNDVVVVLREAFIDGPLTLNVNADYWQIRSAFIAEAYGAEKKEYKDHIQDELQRLESLTNEDEVYLWFEDDLFCLINMLFIIYYITRTKSPRIYRVFPKPDNVHWNGFAKIKSDEIPLYFEHAFKMQNDDIALANELWEGIVMNDKARIKALSFSETDAFRFLPTVMQAHLDRFPDLNSAGRPQQTLIRLLNEGKTDFYEIYEAFWKEEAVYGFGDMQVYNILRNMQIEFTEDLF